jgi:hypothetical protein
MTTLTEPCSPAENSETKIKEDATVTCIACDKTFPVKRSPTKGYKITQHGCLCDECYPNFMTTTVLECGCGGEHHGGYDGTELAIDQMRAANRLWNALVEIDRYERSEYRRLTTDPQLEADLKFKEDALEAINTQIQQQKVQERKKKIKVDPALTAAKKALQADRKAIYGKLKLERERMKVVNASALETLKNEVASKIETVTDSKVCGLSWTMIEPLKARFKTASLRAKKDGTMLKFHRFDGTGIITVPFTNGLPISKVYRSDDAGKFQIATGLMSAHPREKRTQVRVAVASDSSKKPIWLTLPVVLHRPIPPNAEIRNITVRRDLIAGKARWKVCITVRTDAPAKTTNTPACALDTGWRKRADGSIRVAYLVDENDYREELLYPAGDMTLFRKLDDLQSIMGDHFNEIRNTLAAWFRTAPGVPQSVVDACSTQGTFSMHQWKSPRRMVHLMRVWEKNRFAGDDAMFDEVMYWYSGPPATMKPDPTWNGHQHLYSWWCNLSDQLKRKRREQYRAFAAKMAKKYGTIFLEDFDLRTVAMTPEPEKDTEHDKEARYQRTKVATSVLTGAIENVCQREGVKLVKVDASWTTHDCPVCGTHIQFDAATDLMCKCQDCGTLFDQDYVGARNVLDRGLHPDVEGTRVIVA